MSNVEKRIIITTLIKDKQISFKLLLALRFSMKITIIGITKLHIGRVVLQNILLNFEKEKILI